MKLFIPDIGDGLNLDHALDAEALSALLDLPEGELQGAGDGLRLQGRAELINLTVLLRGVVRASVRFTCVRCTEPQLTTLEVPLDAVLEPVSQRAETDEEVELTEDDLNISFYEGDTIDLGPLAREAVLLELPAYPACPDDSASCAEAQRRNLGRSASADAAAEEKSVDPRWAALQSIRDRMGES